MVTQSLKAFLALVNHYLGSCLANCVRRIFRGSVNSLHRFDLKLYSPIVLELAGSCSTTLLFLTALTSLSTGLLQTVFLNYSI